jgi:hypothetical protein
MKTHTRATYVLLAISLALLTTTIAVGIVAALQFRDFVQYGYHANGSCMAEPGHPGASTALAWIALWCAVVGVLANVGGILISRRSMLLVPTISLAVANVVAIWLTWRIISAIELCAPYATG